MTNSINKVILLGNVGKTPEIRSFENGNKCINFNVATNESWKDKETNETKSKTEWHKVVIFNHGLVEIAEKYLKKGSKVYIEGSLSTRKWQDKTGGERYSTEVILNNSSCNMVLLNGKQDD